MLARALKKIVRVEDREIAALLWSCAFFFFILTNNYILRPLRDALGAAGGEEQMPWLFAGTLLGTVLANPIFGWLVARYPRQKFIPFVFRFFLLNLVGFYLLLRFLSGEEQKLAAKIFFVWFSVINLFMVSVFWGLMADLFAEDQGKRFFGFISGGGTLGAIAGSGATWFLSERIDPVNLLLVAAAIFEAALFCMRRLVAGFPDQVRTRSQPGPENPTPRPDSTRGSTGWRESLEGLRLLLRSRYLLLIALYVGLYSICSTFVYVEQARLVKDAFASAGERTAYFAKVDLIVNLLSLVFAAMVTGRLIDWLGLGPTLVVLPGLCLLGFATLGFSPTLGVVVLFQIARRSGDYAISKPAREVLFTVLTREEKYSSKSFIDTFVYRGGDALGAWGFDLLRGLEFSLSAVSFAAIPVALVWCWTGSWLGGEQRRIAPKGP